MRIEECPLVSLTWSTLDFKIKRKEKFNASVSCSTGLLTLGIDHKKVKTLKMTPAQVVETSVNVSQRHLKKSFLIICIGNHMIPSAIWNK